MLAALFVLATAQSGNRVFFQTRNRLIDAKVQLPRLGDRPLERYAAATMERFCRGEIDRMLGDARDPEMKEAPHPFSLDIEPVSVFRTPRLVSVGLEIATYSGGAHGMVNYRTFNFAISDDRFRDLPLSALFRKGSAYTDKVSFALMNQLRTIERADWVQSGEIRELDEHRLRNFVVRPGGTLRFFFPPYELGSYASGPFELDVKPRELTPEYLNPALGG